MKSLEDVYTEVAFFISKQLNSTASDINADSLISELTNDSIQLFELLIAFEKHYEVEMVYEDIVNMHKVGDIVDYVFSNKYSTVS